MHFGEAFALLAKLSPEERQQLLADSSADCILRSAAALLISGERGLSTDDKVSWLVDSLDSAPREVRKYILEALGRCPSSRSTAFLNKMLCDPDLRLDAINALAALGDEGIVPLCEEIIRTGTDGECRSALKALSALGTPRAVAILEAALRSAPIASCREWAAFLLVLSGITTGESLLEKQLSRLQPLRLQNRGPGLEIEPDYLLITVALAQINNRAGLLALQHLLDTVQSDPKIDSQNFMNMTFGLLEMPATTAFVQWTLSMKQWIAQKLAL